MTFNSHAEFKTPGFCQVRARILGTKINQSQNVFGQERNP